MNLSHLSKELIKDLLEFGCVEVKEKVVKKTTPKKEPVKKETIKKEAPKKEVDKKPKELPNQEVIKVVKPPKTED